MLLPQPRAEVIVEHEWQLDEERGGRGVELQVDVVVVCRLPHTHEGSNSALVRAVSMWRAKSKERSSDRRERVANSRV